MPLSGITGPLEMPYNSYQDLIVWQKSVDLIVDIYRLTRLFPADERFGTASQIRRAAMSITHNIAEGHGRATPGEFLNALSVARGSANEVESCLLVSQRLDFAPERDILPLLNSIHEIRRMMASFRRQVQRKQNGRRNSKY